MNRRLLVVLAVLGAAATLGTMPLPISRGDVITSLVHPAGALYVAAGLAAWSQRPENRTGRVMVLTGFLFVLYTLLFTRVPILWTIGAALPLAFTVPQAYLLLSFPSGRLTTLRDRIVFVAVALDILVLQVVAIMPFAIPEFYIGCEGCPASTNLLLVRPDGPFIDALNPVRLGVGAILLITIIAILAARWIRATRPGRRVLGPVLWPGIVLLVAFLVGIAGAYLPVSPLLYDVTGVVQYVGYWLLPIGFLVGLLRTRARRARVGDLVVELGDLPGAARFRDAVARALGDPSVEVGIWSAADGRYRTPEGTALDLPEDGSQQVATPVERRGEPLAVIVHDSALLDDPGLVSAVTAAARLAVENERLQEEVTTQLAEVHASRARIVQAADDERRRVERDLHDGAQQRLVSLSLALRHVESRLDEGADPEVRRSLGAASEELHRAISELRELAQGIHPAVLTEEGLGPAIESLAERSPVPIEITALPDARLPPSVEAAGYFVVSEALANVVKYAEATRAAVSARRKDDRLEIEVTDDGRGGADLDHGSGLRGLADRVAALDGALSVDSPRGRGTRVRAEIPCG